MNRRPPNVLPTIGVKTKPTVGRASAAPTINGGPIELDRHENLIARPEKENHQIAGNVRNTRLAGVQIGPALDGMEANRAANIAKTSIAGRSTNRCRRSR